MNLLGTEWTDWLLPWNSGPVDHAKIAADGKKGSTEAKERVNKASKDKLTTALDAIDELLTKEGDRKSSVETRLTTMVGLASVAATLVTGITLAEASSSMKLENPWRWIIALLVMYLVLQLFDAIHWAVIGLGRRAYSTLTAEDVLPQSGLAEEDWLRQRIVERVEMLHDNRELTNEKVTAMAVAHRAVANFAGGLLALAVVGLASIGWMTAPTNPLVEELKTDGQLRTMLQGAQGPMGPQGAVGPRGERGERGETGPSGKSAPARQAPKGQTTGNR